MSLLDQLKWSFRNLKRQALESSLVVLVIALGIGVIITILGMFFSVREQYRELESATHFRTLEIMDKAGSTRRQGAPLTLLGSSSGTTEWTATLSEIATLQQNLPSTMHAYVENLWVTKTPLLPEEDFNQIYLIGTLPQYFAFQDFEILRGSLFLPSDLEKGNRVTLLTASLAQALFGADDPLGQKVTLILPGGEEALRYTVIGVLNPPFSDGRMAYVPLTSVSWAGESAFSNISVGIEPGVDLSKAQARVQSEAELIWGERIVVRSSLAEFRESQRQMQRYSLLIAILASIGLVIAVINILNLMLARVLRRTKFIGLSIALGSSSSLVFKQFLLEALSLGMLGSLLGILFSFAFGAFLRRVLGGFYVGMLQTQLAIGLVLGLAVSLFFGVYPAYLGSRTNPVEALRSD